MMINGNLLIADDHSLILEGLRSLLVDCDEFGLIDTATDKNALWLKLRSADYHVLVLDLLLGKEDARSFIPELLEEFPELKIVVLTSLGDVVSIQSVLQTGVHAYVVKSESGNEIMKAIRAVLKGQNYLSPQVQSVLLSKPVESVDHIVLSPREKEVLRGILSEASTRQIASELFLSEKTVEHYRSALFTKFDVRNVTGLVKKAILQGFWED